MPTIQASRIQQLNDAFRTTFTGGHVMLSEGFNVPSTQGASQRLHKNYTTFWNHD